MTGISVRASPKGWLKAIAAGLLIIFRPKKKTDEWCGYTLGDQVRLPQEFLESGAKLPPSGMGKRR